MTARNRPARTFVAVLAVVAAALCLDGQDRHAPQVLRGREPPDRMSQAGDDLRERTKLSDPPLPTGVVHDEIDVRGKVEVVTVRERALEQGVRDRRVGLLARAADACEEQARADQQPRTQPHELEAAAGRSTLTVVPRPGELSIPSVPPSAVTMSRAAVKPMPRPP